MYRQQVKNLVVKLTIAHHRRRHRALFCYQFDQVFMIACIYEISIQTLPLFRHHIIYNFYTQRIKHRNVRLPYSPFDFGHPDWLTLAWWQVTGRKRPCLVLDGSLRLRSWQSRKLRCWWHPGDPMPRRQGPGRQAKTSGVNICVESAILQMEVCVRATPKRGCVLGSSPKFWYFRVSRGCIKNCFDFEWLRFPLCLTACKIKSIRLTKWNYV